MPTNPVKQLTKLFQNKNSTTLLSIALALYSAAFAPSVPNSIVLLVDSVPGKLLITFLIAYVANLSVQVAIMLAVAFIVTLGVANERRINEGYQSLENFEDGEDVDDVEDVEDGEPEEEEDEDMNNDMDDLIE